MWGDNSIDNAQKEIGKEADRRFRVEMVAQRGEKTFVRFRAITFLWWVALILCVSHNVLSIILKHNGQFSFLGHTVQPHYYVRTVNNFVACFKKNWFASPHCLCGSKQELGQAKNLDIYYQLVTGRRPNETLITNRCRSPTIIAITKLTVVTYFQL